MATSDAPSLVVVRRIRFRQLTVAFAAMALVCAASGAHSAGEVKNTWTGMSSACKEEYYTIVSTYYFRNTECKELLFAAFNTTRPKDCPQTDPGSQVWNCLTRGVVNPNVNQTTNAFGSVWWTWIGKCDILWVAFRYDPLTEGEATTPESAFTSEQLATQSHWDYENDVPPSDRVVIPSYGVGEGEHQQSDKKRRSRMLKATSTATDEGEAAEFDGLHSYDNSCFMRFDSMEQLSSYFSTDPLAWTGTASKASVAGLLVWILAGFAALVAAMLA